MSNLTNEEITDIWEAMPGQPGGWLKEFGYIQFARAIEKETASRCSANVGITSLEGLHSYDEFGTKIYRAADVERLFAARAAAEATDKHVLAVRRAADCVESYGRDDLAVLLREVAANLGSQSAAEKPTGYLTDDELMDIAEPFHDVGGVQFDEVAFARAAIATYLARHPQAERRINDGPKVASAIASIDRGEDDEGSETPVIYTHEEVAEMLTYELITDSGARTLLNGDSMEFYLTELALLANRASHLARQSQQAVHAVPDVVREAVAAAFEDRPSWRTKIAAAVRAIDRVDLASQEGAHAARNAVLEEAAKVCETAEIPFDVEVWRTTTKQGMTGKTALALAAAIRALKTPASAERSGDA